MSSSMSPAPAVEAARLNNLREGEQPETFILRCDFCTATLSFTVEPGESEANEADYCRYQHGWEIVYGGTACAACVKRGE